MVPLYDRGKPTHYNAKIKRLITQHNCASRCTCKSVVEDIEYLDLAEKITCLSLIEMIIGLMKKDKTGSLFLTVYANWSKTGYSIVWTKVNEDEGLMAVFNLPTFLVREFGPSALKLFSPDQKA